MNTMSDYYNACGARLSDGVGERWRSFRAFPAPRARREELSEALQSEQSFGAPRKRPLIVPGMKEFEVSESRTTNKDVVVAFLNRTPARARNLRTDGRVLFSYDWPIGWYDDEDEETDEPRVFVSQRASAPSATTAQHVGLLMRALGLQDHEPWE